MRLWLNFWNLVMSVGLFLFASLSVTVSFGAFVEIRKMFQKLAEKHRAEKK